MLSSTDLVGNIAGIPVIVEVVNAVNRSALGRKVLDAALGVHPDAPVPPYRSDTLRKQLRGWRAPPSAAPSAAAPAARPASDPAQSGKVALFATCYVNRNEPDIGLDLVRVFEHNGIEVALPERENCCGMPKLELGDLAGGGGNEGQERAAAARHDRARLRHRRADPLLRADVQAGAAADVPGRCGHRRHQASTCSIRSNI